MKHSMRIHVVLAPVMALLAACGDVTAPGGGTDAAAGDAARGVDASQPGLVTVTILDPDQDREPMADVPVVFFEVDGSEAATEMTDSDGVASAELHAGGAVVAFVTSTMALGSFSPLTWAVVDVQPGDEITLGGRPLDNGAVTESMTIELPAMTSSSFAVETRCGSFTSLSNQVVVSSFERCAPDTFSLIGYVFVGDDRYVVTDTDVVFDTDNPHAVEGSWQLVPSPDVTVEGLDDASFLQAGWRRALLGGDNLSTALATVNDSATSDVLTLTPAKVADPEHVMLELTVVAEQPGLGAQLLMLWRDGDGDEDAVLLDAADLLLPWIGVPLIDRDTRQVSWTQVGDGDWDATYLTFYWKATDDESTRIGEWRVVVPPGRHELVLPPVPEAYGEWFPADIDQFLEPLVMLFDSDALDRDSARQLGIDPREFVIYPSTLTEPASLRYSFSIFD
jgi:hypothetical protein